MLLAASSGPLLLSMQSAVHLKMYGLAYVTASSPQPGSSFSADGEVGHYPVAVHAAAAVAGVPV